MIFTFVFADGTEIVSPSVNLPRGPQGPQGEKGPTGYYVKALKETNADSNVKLTMEQSIYYQLTNTNITNIELSLGRVDENTVGEFIVEFTTGSTIPTILLPTNVRYSNGWEYEDYEPNTTYIIYILDLIAFVSYV